MIAVSDEQWETYLKQYRELIGYIATRISGDPGLYSRSDIIAELHIAALESFRGFHKKTGKEVNDILEDPEFVKYTKTCLWNCKNKTGNAIKKRYPLNNGKVSFSPIVESQMVANRGGSGQQVDIERLNKEEKAIIKYINDHPEICDSNGKASMKAIKKGLGYTSCSFSQAISVLKEKLKDAI